MDLLIFYLQRSDIPQDTIAALHEQLRIERTLREGLELRLADYKSQFEGDVSDAESDSIIEDKISEATWSELDSIYVCSDSACGWEVTDGVCNGCQKVYHWDSVCPRVSH